MARGARWIETRSDRSAPVLKGSSLLAAMALLILGTAACSGGSRSQAPGVTKNTSATPTTAKSVQLQWSAPERIDPNQGYASVSCASASFCAAVVASKTVGSAITWNGSSWSAPQVLSQENLNHVSCPSAGF